MQGGKSPNKAQQDWQDWQREQGCSNCGSDNPAIHHCVGSTAKHNRIHIGQFWVIPLCYDCHQGPEGIHYGMDRFYLDNRKENEKSLFELMCRRYYVDHSYEAMPRDVHDAIMDYHR